MLRPMVALRWLALVVVPGVLSGCFAADSAEADDFYMDDDVPAGNCMTGTGCATDEGDDGQGGGAGGTCESTQQCDVGQMCVATFDGDIGEFECSSACIPDMREDRWCLDDEACCEADSICGPRGYCMPGGGTTAAEDTAADETGADATTSADATTTSDTGATSDASTSDTGDATSSTGTGG